MRIVFFIFLVIHSCIHLIGFLIAFGLSESTILKQPISKITGILWLVALILLFYSALLFIFKNPYWMLYGVFGIVISQIVIYYSWHDARFGTIINIIILFAILILYPTWRFNNKYKEEVRKSFRQLTTHQETLLNEVSIKHLPEPVKKYLYYTQSVDKPKIEDFKAEFSGKIRKNKQSEWMPLTSEQYNFIETAKRIFFMKATMKHLPVEGFHFFNNGSAFMDIRLLSLFKVQYQSGDEMGKAETVTFFNDMCCLAPATLIDSRIKWLETRGNQVKASFTNNHITIVAWLYFNDNGELINFVSDDRYAFEEGNAMRKIPWETPLKNYKERNGYKLASYAQAIYKYPEGDLCYGIFNISNVQYNCDIPE
ncbi:DUF6544 family protein [Emticicia sp. BO119]|uniref:DUF6544 family protein n=1 Tax=Emticicia sp. BO119 TaxID=2757768 RepID=UPI0015F0BBF6|nr:DUF6544 family protein [Emticicia sp. BO119]MBA4848966.1 hypothetical protein [Emticicia sp. BO119]